MRKEQLLAITTEIEFTDTIEEAIYILTDGTLVDGMFVDGDRTEEHRVMELISFYDRYDGNEFWLDLLEEKRMLIVEPETQIIYQRIGLTEEQVQPVARLQELGYELMHYC